MTTSLKTCFKCKEEKPRNEFYKHPQTGDGLLGKCKECTKKDVIENYANNFLKKRQYGNERFKRPERKIAAVKYQRKRRLIHPERKRANAMVKRALISGKLIKAPCRECGSLNVQAHHTDYSKPLEVIWLCFSHHRAEHGQTVQLKDPLKIPF